jgi:5-methylcytosine-specific restriction endonuclease McrA
MKLKFCVDLQQHHLRHRAHGGGDEETNLITLCYACHLAAHGKKMRIARQVKARSLPIALLLLAAAAPQLSLPSVLLNAGVPWIY